SEDRLESGRQRSHIRCDFFEQTIEKNVELKKARVAYKGARSSKSEVENRFLRYGCYRHICFHDAESLAGANASELSFSRNTWREGSGFGSRQSRLPFQT